MTAAREPAVSTRIVFNVQVLRAFASVLVVHAHGAGPSGLGLHWVGGTNGVDLFFVISGFIISYVAQTDADGFMRRRLIRIVPIYWMSTLAIYALVLVAPAMFKTTSSDPGLLVRSLLFVPDPHSLHPDGLLHPTLAGGWTLNYEMFFYVLFWIGLMVSRRWAGAIATAMLGGTVALAQLTSLRDNPLWSFYGSTIVLEFVLGIVAFHVVRLLGERFQAKPPPAVAKYMLFAGVALGCIALAFNSELFGVGGERWIQSGLPALLVLLCALLLERLYAARITNKVALAIGDASYVLYLLHAYIVYGVTRLFVHRAFSEFPGQLIVLVLIAISVAISVAVYRFVEQPVLRLLKRMLLPSKR